METTAVPQTAPAGPVYTGATIAVANASGIGGSAGAMSTALTTQGYQGVGEPGNATGGGLDVSLVYYVAGDAAAQAVAQSIATDLGGVQTAEMPTPPPAEGGGVGTATVLVMLGTDTAGRTIADLSGAGGCSDRGDGGPAAGDHHPARLSARKASSAACSMHQPRLVAGTVLAVALDERTRR